MIVRISLDIFAEVEDTNEAEQLCTELDLGLTHNLDNVPVGEIVAADVIQWAQATKSEAARFTE